MMYWILTSSLLILIITALRYMLKGRVGLRLQYALWGLVLVRLLIPFSLGGTRISVMNAAPRLEPVAAEGLSDLTYISTENRVVGYYDWDYMDDAPVTVAEDVSPQEFERMERVLSAGQVFKRIWLAGVGAMGLVFLVSNLSFNIRLKRSRCRSEVRGYPLPVYVSGAVDTPCLIGVFRPAVYVTPQAWEDEAARGYVLEHELTHFRHGDGLWPILRCLCLALHWYNPLVWWAAVLSRRDSELACDEGVIRRLGESQRGGYGRALIGLTCRPRGGFLVAATTMNGSDLKERIRLIAKSPRPAAVTLVLVLLLAALAAGCTFTGPSPEREGGMEEPEYKLIFDSSEIRRITLYRDGGTVTVGREHFKELSDWVGQFKYRPREPLEDGDRTQMHDPLQVLVSYDGDSFMSTGIDTLSILGEVFRVDRPEPPECLEDIWDSAEEKELPENLKAHLTELMSGNWWNNNKPLPNCDFETAAFTELARIVLEDGVEIYGIAMYRGYIIGRNGGLVAVREKRFPCFVKAVDRIVADGIIYNWGEANGEYNRYLARGIEVNVEELAPRCALTLAEECDRDARIYFKENPPD